MSDIEESLSAGESEDEQQTGAVKLNLQDDVESDFDEDDDEEEDDEGSIKPPITLGNTLPSTSIVSETLPDSIIPILDQPDIILDQNEYISEDSNEEEEEEEEDIDYLEKFDNDLKENYLANFHPESKAINYNEINNNETKLL